jgi:opacity protein-like surface antigen
MKSNIKFAAIAAFLAIGVSAYAQEGFVRPEISYVKFSNSVPLGLSGSEQSLKGTIGYGVAGGAFFGDQNEQEVSVSITMADAKASITEPFLIEGISGTISDSIKVKTTTILLNYRYYTGAKADSARFYIGPSIGSSHLQASESATGTADGITDTESGDIGSKNPWTFAISVGCAIKLAEKIDLDVGYRYTYGLTKSWDEHLESNALYAGVSFKF